MPMVPPGRTLLLRRLKQGPSRARGPRPRVHWDAVWIRPEDIVQEGILLSSNQIGDHSVLRLIEVLDGLTQEAAPGSFGTARPATVLTALAWCCVPFTSLILPLLTLPASLAIRIKAALFLSQTTAVDHTNRPTN